MNVYLEAYSARKTSEYKEASYQSYLISRWVWQKKVDIEKILADTEDKKEKKKIMTDDEMLKQVMILNKLFGGEVKQDGGSK